MLLTLAALAAIISPGPLPAFAASSGDADAREALASGATLEIKNVLGSVVATQGTGPNATVHVHATRDGVPQDVKLSVTTAPQRLIVCPIVPPDENCDHHDDRGGNDRVKVDFTVTVPRGVNLKVTSVNGNVVATGLDATVRANVVRGDVRIATSGPAEAHVVSGSIDATIGTPANDAELSFETVSGPIHLTLPHNANASLRASTLNGSIEGPNLAIDQQGYVGRSASGQFGHGGPHLSLHSVNGAISVSLT